MELIKVATSQLGQKEIAGPQHNPTIVGYAHAIGLTWVSDDETPWCAIFAAWCAKQVGLKYPKSALARTWMDVGLPTTQPEPGDVVVFWREDPLSYKGHVGFYMGHSHDGKRVYCLGGNQGNQVSITAYSTDFLLGYRRLVPSSIITLPDAPLKRGNTGTAVVQLQDALKAANYAPGTSDGIFGALTEAALKLLQANGGLKVDGVYDKKTRVYLMTVLGG